MKTYITGTGSVSFAVCSRVGTRRKIMQFGISVFLKVQKLNFQGTLKVNISYVTYFYVKCFRFTKKFLLLLTLQNAFTSFDWCSLVDNINCTFIKKASKFSRETKAQKVFSAEIERLQQNTFNRLRSSNCNSSQI